MHIHEKYMQCFQYRDGSQSESESILVQVHTMYMYTCIMKVYMYLACSILVAVLSKLPLLFPPPPPPLASLSPQLGYTEPQALDKLLQDHTFSKLEAHLSGLVQVYGQVLVQLCTCSLCGLCKE